MAALTYLASLISRSAALGQLLAARFLEHGTGRFLDHLLVTPLDGAVPLVEVKGVAFVVGDDLDLHVPGLDDELLEIDAAVSEGRLGLGAGRIEGGAKADVVVDDAHAPPAAAGDRLDDDRVSDLVGEFHAPRPRRPEGPSEPGTIGTLTFLASLRASTLSPSRRMASTGGPMKMMPQSRQISAKLMFSARNP